MAKGNTQSDYWQLRVGTAIDGERRGILLYVCHPIMQVYDQVILWGGQVNRGRTTASHFAERCAGKLEIMLKDKGISILNGRSRIADLIEDRWVS